jgi:hypothetical protein
LSPWNKTPGDGMSEYLVKRNKIFNSRTNLVEIDLLRGGHRMPTIEPLAPADFYAFVCRSGQLPTIEVYEWGLRDRLPVIPIPLADDDRDAPLDLQQAFATNYDRCGFDYAIKYAKPVEPPLDEASNEWVRTILQK